MNILYQRIYNQFSIIAPLDLTQQLEQIQIDKEYITNIIVIVGTHECKKKTHHLRINDQMLLKIEKDSTKPPITDLSFYYLDVHEQKLKLNNDLNICTIQEDDSKWHYQNGNLDFTYDLSKVFGYQSNHKTALILCYKTDPMQDPWSDLILIQKNQVTPEGFYKLPQSIQNNYLAYSLANTYHSVKYQYEITDSYPQNNDKPEVAMFCFPNGISLYRNNQFPKYNHYILTSETGERTYCTALIFCEQNLQGFHEMAIVLSSHYCYSEQSLELLKNLYQIYIAKNVLPLERYICNIVDEIVLPQDPTETYIYNGSKQIFFYQSNCFPLCSNQAFQCLFAMLNKKNIVLLYFALLYEKKIQLISSKPVISSLVIEALLTLLYPFEFTHILISSLPEDLEQYLEAPLPYLIGINKKQAEKYPDAIQVFLDSNNIKQSQPIDVPEDIFDKFVLKLKEFDKYYNPQLIDTIGDAFPMPREDDIEMIDQYQVREVFLRFNIFLLNDYKKFIDKQNFKEKLFLKSKQKIKQFLEPFMETRLFNFFIQERMQLSQNDSQLEYFDDCLKNPKGDHFTLPVQIFKDYLQPNDEGFKKEKHFQYCTFPLKLNDQFFSKPRLEFLKHENPFSVHLFPKTQIDILRFELSHIYKQWFRCLVYKIEEGKIELMDLVKYSIHLLKEMKQNNLYIDSDIFKNAMIACAHYKMNDLALQFIQQMRELGYQKQIQIYQYYFQTQQNNKKQKNIQKNTQQTGNLSSGSLSNRQAEYKFYLDAKCPRCGRRYVIEDILASFVKDHLECKSNGTLGCNNTFDAQLYFNDEVHYLKKPSKVEKGNKVNNMFYFYLIGLPYKFIKNQSDDDIVYSSKKIPIYIDYGDFYTDENDDCNINYIQKVVHEVFGMFLERMKDIISKQELPKGKHQRRVSDLSD
ncbi:unnamed protein product [Paramecium primaurelia]|uniref:UDENN domain-containing protein n=1 Tax=Paramecium primaurelia TaxID=5886 RepID=A0A8S1NHN9_PARPR|nr:unnamed protein product [Paramecium primaurelia]